MVLEERRIDLNGHELILRSPREEDAEMLIDGLREVCGETRFLLTEPGEISLTIEQEQEWIRKKNESERSLAILGFLDGEYVGNCSLDENRKTRFRHRAEFGIALYQRFTGMGIGRVMMETLLEKARDVGLEQLELRVNADNPRAQSLYKKMGFEECGRGRNYFKFSDGTYADDIWMMLDL